MTTQTPGGPLDFNFYPERHIDELEGLLDLQVPQGWDVGRFIEALHDAKVMLWAKLISVDDDGKVRWR